jgi:hypothetical protein
MIPESILRKVLFPQPEGPTTAVKVPAGKEAEAFSMRKRGAEAELGKIKQRLRVSIIDRKSKCNMHGHIILQSLQNKILGSLMRTPEI